VSEGWHDAGNYEKYSNNTAFTVLHLITAWEIFGLDIDFIPGGDPGIPDVLEEARVGLEWLARMQRDDGSVHHSVVVEDWSYWGCSPEEHDDVRYVTGITSFDTAYAAAAFAAGSRVFRNFDPAYAEDLLRRAELARRWLEDHPSLHPPGGYHPLTETDAY
jgi:endoglucanase